MTPNTWHLCKINRTPGLVGPAYRPMVVGLLIFVDSSFQKTAEATPHPSALKKLSLEELMNIRVVSVSKRPEK